MTEGLILLAVSLLSSFIGAIVGIGGGLIERPILDLTGILSARAVTFFSGCMVLSMSVSSLVLHVKAKQPLQLRRMAPLAAGAALGGVCGKLLLQAILNSVQKGALGFYQDIAMLVLIAACIPLTVFKDKIPARNMQNRIAILLAGLVLGLISSFLGIGGGPFNMMVLFFLFSMDTKTASIHSLFTILCSQAAGLLLTVCAGQVPRVRPMSLALIVAGGVGGALIGRAALRRLSLRETNRTFLGALVLIAGLCLANVW